MPMAMPLCYPFPAAEAVSGNQYLITDILVRLPVKSLLRFKCVSKQWLSLISDPQFFRHHRSLASAASIILCQTTDVIDHVSLDGSNSDPPFTSLGFINDSSGVKILQSSNGLLLCRSLFELGKTRSYYICNPSTRQYLLLPPPNNAPVGITAIHGVHLAFDPSKSPYYQVICIRSCSTSEASYDQYRIEIYSSETCTWRLSGSPFVAPFDMVFDNAVLWNGTLHWISPTGASLCFNIDQERLGEMPTPPSHDQGMRRRQRRMTYFGESGGHLHLIEIYCSGTTQFQVFEMERNYSSWLPKYQVNLATVIDTFPEMVRSYLDAHDSRFYAFVLLFVQENEDDSSLLLHIPGKFISYNLRDRTFKKLLCYSGPNTSLQIRCFQVYEFIETLAAV